MGSVTTVTSSNFDREVLSSDQLVLVDFYAPWCGPCLRLAPAVDSLAVELEGLVKVVKLNVDQDSELAERFHVMGIPNLVLFSNGRPVDRILGMAPREIISETISRHLAA
jgi:thioredoxin 1